jgi:hypothetical protein
MITDSYMIQTLLKHQAQCLKKNLEKKSFLKIEAIKNVNFKVTKYFLTISHLFSIPKNCSNLKFHCPLEMLHF